MSAPDPRPIADVLREHTPRLLSIPGVVGTAEGRGDDGTPVIQVLASASTPELEAALPKALGGHPVVVLVVGELEARPEDDD